MLDLAAYTDPGTMRPLLQAALCGDSGRSIGRLDVRHALRRAPRRNPHSAACHIAVCYEAEMTDAAVDGRRREIFYGKVFAPQAAAGEMARAEAAIYLRDIDMILWRFPGDPALPQLATLLDPLRVAAVMPAAFAGAVPAAELLRYRPEERAMLRWRWEATGRSLIGKTFAATGGAEVYRRFAHFAGQARSRDAFLVAEPLAYDAELRTFWQRGVDASPLSASLDAGDIDWAMQATARGLARLHASTLAAPRRERADLLAAARRRAAKITRTMPELAASAAGVATALAAAAPDLPAVAPALLHGDFHVEQLRRRDDRLFVFDFDEFACGDPHEDLASFIVKSPPPAGDRAERVAAALVEAYSRCRPGVCNRRLLNWHLAVQWLLRASRAYVWQRPGWREQATEMLARAADCAGAVGRRGGV